MPFFEVTKGHDAFVEYVTLVEADNADAAQIIAGSWQFEGKWLSNGITNEYDHSEVFEDRTEAIEAETIEAARFIHEQNYPETVTRVLEMPQRNTILAALRYYQAHLPSVSDEITEIATDGGSHPALSANEIDDLCEEINLG